VERPQFMLNFVVGVDNLDVDGIVGRRTWTALLRRWLLFSQPG
jgi:hypothetical protein